MSGYVSKDDMVTAFEILDRIKRTLQVIKPEEKIITVLGYSKYETIHYLDKNNEWKQRRKLNPNFTYLFKSRDPEDISLKTATIYLENIIRNGDLLDEHELFNEFFAMEP